MRSLLVFLLFLFSCIAGNTISPSHPYIQIVGRTIPSADSVIFSWSGVSINVQITGTSSLSVLFSQLGYYGVPMYFDVFVDGVQGNTITVQGQSAQQQYTVATGLSTGSHKVQIVRRNEASFGATTFYGLVVDAGGSLLELPPRPSRRIEFIGDSITCGSGDLGIQPCDFGLNQDAYWSHGAITSRNLGADYFITAWSGIGLVRNYDDYSDPSTAPLPVLYPYVVGDNSAMGQWDFTKWVPQAVVINLGTNDFWYEDSALPTNYINGYYNFISQIKSYYDPDPEFFLVCGPMSTLYCQYAQEVANAVGATYIDLTGLLIIGCDDHPSVAGQTNMATVETNSIAAKLGWTPVSSTIATASVVSTISTVSTVSTSSSGTIGSGGSGVEIVYQDAMSSLWDSWSWASSSLTNTNPALDKYSIAFYLNDFGGLSYHRVSPISAGSFTSFVFSVNGGSLSNVPLLVYLFDTESTPQPVGKLVSIPSAVQANTWVTETISTSSFGVSASTLISGIAIQFNLQENEGVIFVDNIYFTTTSSTSSLSSTSSSHSTTASISTTGSTSTTSAAPRLQIYSDALVNGFSDWTWGGAHSLTNTNPVYSGTYSISFSLSNWDALSFYTSSPLTLSSFSSVVFRVNGGSLANVALTVSFRNAASTLGNSVPIPAAVKANQWVTETIPITSFGLSLATQVYGLNIQFAGADSPGVIYIDDIYLG